MVGLDILSRIVTAAVLAVLPAAHVLAATFDQEQLHAATAIEAAMALAEPAAVAATQGSGDSRLADEERIFGIVVGTEPRAYSLSDLSRAGGHVDDVVDGGVVTIDAGRDAVPVVTRNGARIEGGQLESWATWSAQHRDTSVWRPSAEPGLPATRPVTDVRIEETRSYATAISCALSQSLVASNGPASQGLFVITGSLTNTAAAAIHHVLLRFELVDELGRIVYREDGYNRAAESMAAPGDDLAGDVEPLAPGAHDSFRMILVSAELPRFETARVQVAAVY
ncbi:MAG TPA: hypothetical protein VEL28_15800 [Candidatus Binatia bacterium]|nr:hypothetical protein [Candidatus Binatia bacterium]